MNSHHALIFKECQLYCRTYKSKPTVPIVFSSGTLMLYDVLMMKGFTLETETLQSALEGNTKAQLDLYSRIRSFSIHICMKHYRLTLHDSEEVCQKVASSFFRNLGYIERPDSWLYAAIKRQSLKIKAEKAASAKEETNQEVAESREEESGQELRILLWDMVLQLGKRCLDLIISVFILGCTEKETSAVMGVPTGSVFSLKRDCLAQLFDLYTGGKHEARMLHHRRTHGPDRKRETPEGLRDM